MRLLRYKGRLVAGSRCFPLLVFSPYESTRRLSLSAYYIHPMSTSNFQNHSGAYGIPQFRKYTLSALALFSIRFTFISI
jgi:hypothetical protein